jgi:hypothetical protein
MSATNKADEIRQLTKRREEELMRARDSFRRTMQHIYSQISEYKAINPNLESVLRESLLVLRLSGAKDDQSQLVERPTINHFFTKVNLDLD